MLDRNWGNLPWNHFSHFNSDFWCQRHHQSPSKWRLRAHMEAIWTLFQARRVCSDMISRACLPIKWQIMYRIRKFSLHNSQPSPGETNRGFECTDTCKDMEPQKNRVTTLIYAALQLSNTVTWDNYMVTFPTTVNCSTKTRLCKETQVGSFNQAQSSTPRMDNFAICQHGFENVQHAYVGQLHGHIYNVC